MSTTRKFLFSLAVAVIIGSLVVGLGAGYGGWWSKGAARSNGAGKLDPNKAPPESTKEIPVKGQPDNTAPAQETAGNGPAAKDTPKLLTMAEAVTIAEKLGKGYTVRAERVEQPEVRFQFDIMGIGGTKNKIELSADGKLLPPSKTAMTGKAGTKKGGGGKGREMERERENRPPQIDGKKRERDD